MLINPKFKAPMTIDNYSRLIVISNHNHFLHIKQGDRRYTVLESCSAWKGTNKFDHLVDQWANGGAARFVWEALNHSFRQFDDRQRFVISDPIKTEAGVRQMAHSRSALEKCMVALLLDGGFDGQNRSVLWSLEEPWDVTSKNLQAGVQAWLKSYDSNAARHEAALHQIIDMLEKYIGETQTSRQKGTRNPNSACRPQLPTVRHLPLRREAIQRAWERGLLTDEEYASIEPPRPQHNKSSGLDEFCIFEEPLEEPEEEYTEEDDDPDLDAFFERMAESAYRATGRATKDEKGPPN